MFRFKKFSCSHESSSMKIGVDAVLLGAWADVSGTSIIDVGTGCGVIALMCAQRNSNARIVAIDIDPDSVEEAALNFSASPWGDRLSVSLSDFSDIAPVGSFDLVVSNPPYFSSGISNPDSARLMARHQGGLSPLRLLEHGRTLLGESGRIALVVPFEQADKLRDSAYRMGLHLRRRGDVKGHPAAPCKRSLLEFSGRPVADPIHETIVLEESPGMPAVEYRRLCGDFYLKF